MPNTKVTIKNPNANLNVTLSKDQLNSIIRGVIGPNGKGFNPVALASDYCCVDASVGSSVAGPVSSVASSVSVQGDKSLAHVGNVQQELQHTLDAQHSKINIQVPGDIKFK
jgi:hypothetical protein